MCVRVCYACTCAPVFEQDIAAESLPVILNTSWKLRKVIFLQGEGKRGNSRQGLASTTTGHNNVWGAQSKEVAGSKVVEGLGRLSVNTEKLESDRA